MRCEWRNLECVCVCVCVLGVGAGGGREGDVCGLKRASLKKVTLPSILVDGGGEASDGAVQLEQRLLAEVDRGCEFGGLVDGQLEEERRPLALLALHAHGAMVRHHQVFDDGKPQSSAPKLS